MEPAIFGSGAILGHRDVDYMKKFRDKDGISIYEAMKEYGMDPERIKEAVWEDGKSAASWRRISSRDRSWIRKAQSLDW